MSTKVFLHAGLPKSGTTFVQAVLGKNKKQLGERAGLLYPGRDWLQQIYAVRDLREMAVPPGRGAQIRGAWSRLAAEMNAWPGTSVISMEWLVAADKEHIERIVADLDGAEVHAVLTVRDLGRTLPAAWQEFVQNRSTFSWPEFLAAVSADDPYAEKPGKAFWRQQHVEDLVGRWAGVLGTERVHVVTVPAPGGDPALLWERFCKVVGIDPSGYRLRNLTSNESLGLESVELMRRINSLSIEAGISQPDYHELFKKQMAKRNLSTRKRDESVLVVPEQLHGWVRERAAEQVRMLQTSGVDVVGDLRDLEPVLPVEGVQPEDLDPEAILDAAVQGLVAIAALRSRERQAAREKERRQQEAASEPWRARLRGALVRAERNHPTVGRAGRLYRSTRGRVRRGGT
jgi:hypothetical protein